MKDTVKPTLFYILSFFVETVESLVGIGVVTMCYESLLISHHRLVLVPKDYI